MSTCADTAVPLTSQMTAMDFAPSIGWPGVTVTITIGLPSPAVCSVVSDENGTIADPGFAETYCRWATAAQAFQALRASRAWAVGVGVGVAAALGAVDDAAVAAGAGPDEQPLSSVAVNSAVATAAAVRTPRFDMSGA